MSKTTKRKVGRPKGVSPYKPIQICDICGMKYRNFYMHCHHKIHKFFCELYEQANNKIINELRPMIFSNIDDLCNSDVSARGERQYYEKELNDFLRTNKVEFVIDVHEISDDTRPPGYRKAKPRD